LKEPLWREVLCWGAVICFFLFPLTAFSIVVYSTTIGSVGFLDPKELAFFREFVPFEATLATLVFGLAGLNTWDKRNGVIKKEKEKEQ
jgi:hypothetical protein